VKDPKDWATDEWVAFFLALGLGGPLLVSRFVDLGQWLQRHHILVAPSEALLAIPGLGGFDAVRLLVVVAAATLLVLLVLGGRRRTRTSRD